mmetsp:Transcript_27797/g.63913  ORF Transcript_27797/g.63913 Transcript_27797/m.63913 type:complete len:215 (+) Transcript_27797:737-1381(+)
MAVVHRNEFLLKRSLVRPWPVAADFHTLALLSVRLAQTLPSLRASLPADQVVKEHLGVARPCCLFLLLGGELAVCRVVRIQLGRVRLGVVLVGVRAHSLAHAVCCEVNFALVSGGEAQGGQHGHGGWARALARGRALFFGAGLVLARLHVEAFPRDARLLFDAWAAKLWLVDAVDTLPAIPAVAVVARPAARETRSGLLRRRRRRRSRIRQIRD